MIMAGASSGESAVPRPPHGSNERSTVYVAGIPSDVSEEDLKKLFHEVEGLVEVTLTPHEGKKKNYAVVKYNNEASASKAIKKFDKQYLNKGNKITVFQQGTKPRGDFNREVEEANQGSSSSRSQEDVISYTIGDKEGYIEFIAELRQKFASRKDDVVDIFEDEKNRPCSHPLLVEKPSGKIRWIQVELCEKRMGMQTTLAVRKDNLYVKGFKNNVGRWFELPAGRADNDDMKLPGNYKAAELKGWDVSYRGMMKLHNKDQVKKTLMSTRLGKAFLARAVRRLSRYSVPDEDNNDNEDDTDTNPIRLGLAGLIVMICEAARMNPFLDTIAGGWNGGTGLTARLLDIMWDWGSMSAALLKWKKSGYRKWPIKCKYSLGTALASIHLVLDSADVTGSGPTWVEIVAVSADFPVISVTVLDEAKCKNVIYKQEMEQVQEEQRQQGILVPLELSLKGRRISGYESFSMEVVLPPSPGSGDCITKKFKWDCRRQEGDAAELVPRSIIFDHRRKIDVTYLVMHNAVEAKVEVKLWLKGEPREAPEYLSNQRGRIHARRKNVIGGKKYTACGEITAQIDGFEDHQIVLFRSAVEVEFPLDLDTSMLMRSVVSVPLGTRLHIDTAALHIREAPDDRVIKTPGRLSFDFGRSTPTTSVTGDQVDDNIEVEVNVAWPAQEKTVEIKPDVVFTIGDVENFNTSIKELRRVLVCHPHPEDALDGYTGEALPNTGNHPVLARPRPEQQPRWIHVKLQVVAGEETLSMTLALRDDKCFGAGFMNQNGVWYDLGKDHWISPLSDKKQLPPEYNSVLLDWAEPYLLSWWFDEQYRLLIAKRLGKNFARAAVRMLSRYPDVNEREKPKLALAGLTIMVCESARFNAIFESIASAWDTGMGFTRQLYGYTQSWVDISRALLRWKDHGHNRNRWPSHWVHNEIRISSPVDALLAVCLLFNSDERTKQIDMEYIIEDQEGFTRFNKKLRDVLAYHDHKEGILDGHPNPESVSALKNPAVLARQRLAYRWPARLIHIKLQVAEEKTSTTLAVRGDNAYLVGFMNQGGVWYDLGRKRQVSTFEFEYTKGERLPAEFSPEPTNWGSYKDILGIRDRLPALIRRGNQDVDVSVWDKVREKLCTEGLGKDFAMKAVRTLSRYPDVVEGECPRLALAGLIIMVCESARLNPVHKHIEDSWDGSGIGFPKQMMEYIQRSDLISETLLRWKDSGYRRWPMDHYGLHTSISEMSDSSKLCDCGMGIHGPEHALDLIHLVPNTRLLQWD